jgi:hypothetical protein
MGRPNHPPRLEREKNTRKREGRRSHLGVCVCHQFFFVLLEIPPVVEKGKEARQVTTEIFNLGRLYVPFLCWVLYPLPGPQHPSVPALKLTLRLVLNNIPWRALPCIILTR